MKAIKAQAALKAPTHPHRNEEESESFRSSPLVSIVICTQASVTCGGGGECYRAEDARVWLTGTQHGATFNIRGDFSKTRHPAHHEENHEQQSNLRWQLVQHSTHNRTTTPTPIVSPWVTTSSRNTGIDLQEAVWF